MKKFKVKLEGPPGCGKTTFLQMIIRNTRNEAVSVTKVKEHELEVTMFRSSSPTIEED